jgi:FkbM family methyltransferase
MIYQPTVNRILRNVNKMLSPLMPGVKLPPSGVLDVKLKTGAFRFSTNQTNTTSQLIFWNGPYQIEYTVIFEDLIKRCKCFYDIGAHAGYYSLIAAAVNPTIRVVAFEPAHGPYHYLNKNIAINHFGDRILAVPAALGNNEGSAQFLEVVHAKYGYLEHNLVAVGNLSHEQPNRKMKSITVPITRLDHFARQHPDLIPDILKMDTEGTEHFILRGAMEMLKHQPIVISETLFNTIEHELEKIMKPLGYEFFNYKDGRLHKTETIVRSIDNGVHDCFFVPKSKQHLIAPYLA